jgi:hypothetical protein
MLLSLKQPQWWRFLNPGPDLLPQDALLLWNSFHCLRSLSFDIVLLIIVKIALSQKRVSGPSLCCLHNLVLKGYKGYKDGLQPESLADGNWLMRQNQPVSKIETKSDTNLRSLYES